MLLLFLALVAPAGAQTTVILLGTGNPYPSPSRQGPATAVTVGDRFFLFDAGTGVMRQANAAGLPIGGPEACFFTHLHNDHTLGYPDLLLTSWVMHRATPFPVYGPPGPKAMTDAIFVATGPPPRPDSRVGPGRPEGYGHDLGARS